MDFSTLTLLAGLLSCIVGIATFVTGMNARAQKDGILEQKINQAIEGIEEIKKDLKATSSNQTNLALAVNSHGEELKTVFRFIDSLESRQNSLDARLNNQESTKEALGEIIAILKGKGE